MSSEKRERSYQRPEDPTNSALTSARQQEQVEVPAASSGSLQQGAVPLHLIQEQQQHRKRRERVSSISGQDQTVTAVSAAAAAGGGRRYEETAGALSAPQTCGAKGGGVRQQEPSSSSKDRPSYSGHKQPEEFQLQRGSTDYSSAEYAKRGVNGGQGRGGSSLTLPIEERGAVSGRRERSPVRRRTDLVPDSNAPGASPPSRASSSLRPDFIPRSTTPRPPSIRRERGGERGRDRERESREAYREAYADSVGRHSMTGREKTRERELASASSPRRLSPSPSSRVRVVAPGDRAEREWIADGGRDRQNSHTKMVIPPQNLQVRQRQVRPFRRSQSPRYESATSHHVDMDNVRSSKGPSQPRRRSPGRSTTPLGSSRSHHVAVVDGTPRFTRQADSVRSSAAVGGEIRRSQPLIRLPPTRIDPDQVPRPTGYTDPVEAPGGKRFDTDKYVMPPAADTVYTVVDRGSAACRFHRLTTSQIPATPQLAASAHVPVALMAQPLADLGPYEPPIPLLDFSRMRDPVTGEGTLPPRCSRCKAYVNPFMGWVAGGSECFCNLCEHCFELPRAYALALDAFSKRRDLNDRPELTRGTVDILVPKDYWTKAPTTPIVVLVMEVTYVAVTTKVVSHVAKSMRSLVRTINTPGVEFALITYDSTVHFYPLNDSKYPRLRESMLVMPDIQSPFVPAPAELLCADLSQSSKRVAKTLESVGKRFEKTNVTHSAGNAALEAAVELCNAKGGGHILIVYATLPDVGVGAIEASELAAVRQSALESEKDKGDRERSPASDEVDKTLFSFRQEAFYRRLFAKCQEGGVGVSVFCCPQPFAFIDFATLAEISVKTGGRPHLYSDFSMAKDGEHLFRDLERSLFVQAGYDCQVKIRTGKGLFVDKLYGPYTPSNPSDPSQFNCPRIDADHAFTVVFRVAPQQRVDESKNAFIQCAILFTSCIGQRLLRVMTLATPMTTSLSLVFRYTDSDILYNVMQRRAADCVRARRPFRKELMNLLAEILHSYRLHCSSTTTAGQLILPESLKLLPLFGSSLFKQAAFRPHGARADERVASLLRMIRMPASWSPAATYPRLYPLYKRFATSRTRDREFGIAGLWTGILDNVHLPITLACSAEKITTDGCFLIDTDTVLWMYLGPELDPEWLREAFGVSEYAQLDMRATEDVKLIPEEGKISEVIWRVVEQVRRDKGSHPHVPLRICTHSKVEENNLLYIFVEDPMGQEMSYVDFLCMLHRQVQSKIE